MSMMPKKKTPIERIKNIDLDVVAKDSTKSLLGETLGEIITSTSAWVGGTRGWKSKLPLWEKGSTLTTKVQTAGKRILPKLWATSKMGTIYGAAATGLIEGAKYVDRTQRKRLGKLMQHRMEQSEKLSKELKILKLRDKTKVTERPLKY